MDESIEGVDVVSVLGAVTAGILVVDRDGVVTYANETTIAMAGATAADVVGTRFDAAEWKARDRTGRLLSRDEYPIGRALAGEVVVGGELLVDSPERGTVVLMASAVPLRAADGSVTGAVATIQDVTDATGWELRVEASQARFAAVFDHATEAMLLFDDDGRYLQANPAAGRLLGRSPEGLVGVHYTEVMADSTGTESRWGELMRDGVKEDLVDLRRLDGSVVTVAAQSVAGVEPGAHLTVWRDVTEQRRTTEALEQAVVRERAAVVEQTRIAAMKDVFLSAVSHELRTPLTTISGFNDTLRTRADQLDRDMTTRLLERQHEHIVRLHDMLEDLLDLDRLRRGLALVDPTEAVLSEVVEEAIEEFGIDGVHVEVAAADLLVDTAKVRRIVGNLVANASKHTPDGTRIEVRGHVDGGTAVLEVEDDGPGLAPELRDVAFEMFVKGSGDHARTSGTGVGLGLVRQFARLLGGDAVVDHGALGGLLVRVTFPTHHEA